jgi:hypothetical protein
MYMGGFRLDTDSYTVHEMWLRRIGQPVLPAWILGLLIDRGGAYIKIFLLCNLSCISHFIFFGAVPSANNAITGDKVITG